MSSPLLVSIHGGHSGQFCNHASDTLEAVVAAYAARGFSWVGITEHMPPVSDAFLYPDEIDAGLDAAMMLDRFRDYLRTCRELKQKFVDYIQVFVGFETETYTGTQPFIEKLLAEHAPDYVVGSIHHAADKPVDMSREVYEETATALGGIDALYCRYFDEQHEMIQALSPAVVGHMDLVRIFDPDYKVRMRSPDIWRRVIRNLDTIKQLGLILDLNLRGFDKPGAEQYPTRDILEAAIARQIAVVPGDDSHGTKGIGCHFDRGVELLRELGADTDWKQPVANTRH